MREWKPENIYFTPAIESNHLSRSEDIITPRTILFV